MRKYGEIMETQGRIEQAIKTAKNLIKLGILTINQIAQSTGLSEEKVIEIKETVKNSAASSGALRENESYFAPEGRGIEPENE